MKKHLPAKLSFTNILLTLLFVTNVANAQLSSFPTPIDFTAAKPAYITTPSGTSYNTALTDCSSNTTGGISYTSSGKSWTLTATKCGPIVYTIKQPSTARAVTVSNNKNGVTKTTTNTKNTCETDTLDIGYDGTGGDITITFAGGSGGSGEAIVALTLYDYGTSLPVTFTGFNAHEVNSGISLNWSVGVETNITGYEIESSSDGKTFSKIGTLTAQGNQVYSFIDATTSNANFYRIKAIENSGNVAYTNILNYRNSANIKEPLVVLNPVINHSINLSLNALKKDNYTVSVYNLTGVKVFTTAVNHPGGSSVKTLQLPSSILKGMYVLKLTGITTQLNKTIIVQ